MTTDVAFIDVDPSGAGTVAQSLVDVEAGTILTTDRYKGYHFWPVELRQLCWAHLRRDFQAMIDRSNAATKIGEDLLFLSDLMFDTWHRVRDGTLGPQGHGCTGGRGRRHSTKMPQIVFLARG